MGTLSLGEPTWAAGGTPGQPGAGVAHPAAGSAVVQLSR